MCTLTIAWQAFEAAPVVVAANRDERLDRPSEPPSVLETDPTVVAPRDAEAGGTWVGFNEHGVFVGVTNRWVDRDLAGERSRGLLVRDALRQPSAEAVRETVAAATAADEYDGFNLVAADAADAFHLAWDGELTTTRLEPGVHVVVNVGFDDTFAVPSHRPEVGERQAGNARRVRAELAPREGEDAAAWRERAAAVLGDHEYGVCVHGDGYGTVSSSLLTLGERPEYAFAPGPPCETPHEPVDLEGQF